MVITPLYAGLLAILFLILSVRVVQGRRGKGRPSLGDGGDAGMLRRIRGHANFAEYVPLILFMMAVLELGGLRGSVLHALGATLVLARVLHAYALSFTAFNTFGRFWGALLTFVVLMFAGLLCLARGIRGL